MQYHKHFSKNKMLIISDGSKYTISRRINWLTDSQFTSVGEERINNQFASWMKDNLIYVWMFCISKRTTVNYFWNPSLHALYIANIIINGVWYYFPCKFSCSYFKVHSCKPHLTDTSLHGHLFYNYRWFSWSQRYQSPFSFHFTEVSIFLEVSVWKVGTKLCPFGAQKKWFYCTYFHIEAPNSANYHFICLCYFAFFPLLCFQYELKWDSHSYFQVSR